MRVRRTHPKRACSIYCYRDSVRADILLVVQVFQRSTPYVVARDMTDIFKPLRVYIVEDSAIIGVPLALGAIAWLVLDPGRFLTLDRLHEDQQWLSQLKNANPVLFGALFFAVYVLVTGVSLPGAAIVTLASGALFGLLSAYRGGVPVGGANLDSPARATDTQNSHIELGIRA
jgi:hypothetical protein